MVSVDVAGSVVEPGGPASAPLFRPEAITAAKSPTIGRPIALMPISWTVLAGLLVLMAATFTWLMLMGSYARTERAVGVVRASGTAARVGVPIAGTLSELYAHEGQRVRAGDPLAAISTERFGVDGVSADNQVIDSLDRELNSLSDRLAALPPASALQAEGTNAKIAALISSKVAERAAETSAAQRLRLAEASLKRMEPVATRGFISSEAMRQRYEEVISLHDAEIEARSRQAALDGQIAELRTERRSLPLTLIQQRGDILSQISRARRDRGIAAAQRGYLVRAPVGGEVTALQVRQGQAVDPRLALMTVAPVDTAVTAELYLPSRAIGFVRTGQLVRIRYDAFPFQRFGTGSGRITHVSLAVLRPEDIEAPITIKEPMYRVVVAIDRPWFGAYGHRYRIQAGMALDADVVLEERSFGAWLLEPLLALRGRL